MSLVKRRDEGLLEISAHDLFADLGLRVNKPSQETL